jgi:hypothetical protein
VLDLIEYKFVIGVLVFATVFILTDVLPHIYEQTAVIALTDVDMHKPCLLEQWARFMCSLFGSSCSAIKANMLQVIRYYDLHLYGNNVEMFASSYLIYFMSLVIHGCEAAMLT